MKFTYEEDETVSGEHVGFLDIELSHQDLTCLLDDEFCEGTYRERVFLKRKLNICIRRQEDAIEERQEPQGNS